MRFELRNVCLISFIHHRLALTHISKTSADDQNPVKPLIYACKDVKRLPKNEHNLAYSGESFVERWYRFTFSRSVLPSCGINHFVLSQPPTFGFLRLKP